MVTTNAERTTVLIVGGGVVGLSAALLLQRHGVAAVLVERHPGTAIHPRARSANARTMEIYRELGVAEAIREAGAALAPAFGMLTGTTLVAALAARSQGPAAPPAFFTGSAELGPTGGARCTQDLLEPVLLAAARGGELRYNTALLDFAQDDTGVAATLLDRATGAQGTMHADYLIAADGAGSTIRAALGVGVHGRGLLGHQLNILFRADLRELVRGREFSLCTIARDGINGLFTAIDNAERWVFHLSYDPARGERPDDFPPARCVALLREALGLPDAAITIKGVLPWEAAARVADRLRGGRVFLAGDAAHQMPPWSGMGAATGVADVHNLAWKLALVARGLAAPALLDTYEAERLPVGEVAPAAAASVAGASGLLASERALATFSSAPITIGGYGHRYASAAISPEGATAPEPLALDGRPGTRVPHLWITQGGARCSTLDLGGRGFALLAGPAGASWCGAARALAARSGLAIAAQRIGAGGELCEETGQWTTSAGITAAGALLVRPDGFVAWRGAGAAADPREVLAAALGRALGR